ncbi:hypothetical protein FRC03_001235 [Tulasnella sp. 419]|nr:hypothetical protein FRC03_001235 [Tulasnella sp. 419]
MGKVAAHPGGVIQCPVCDKRLRIQLCNGSRTPENRGRLYAMCFSDRWFSWFDTSRISFPNSQQYQSSCAVCHTTRINKKCVRYMCRAHCIANGGCAGVQKHQGTQLIEKPTVCARELVIYLYTQNGLPAERFPISLTRNKVSFRLDEINTLVSFLNTNFKRDRLPKLIRIRNHIAECWDKIGLTTTSISPFSGSRKYNPVILSLMGCTTYLEIDSLMDKGGVIGIPRNNSYKVRPAIPSRERKRKAVSLNHYPKKKQRANDRRTISIKSEEMLDDEIIYLTDDDDIIDLTRDDDIIDLAGDDSD